MTVYRLFFCISFGLLVSGCGRKTVPTSVTQTQTEKKDSTSVKNTTQRVDSSYVETVTEKKIAGSQVDLQLTKSQFDSLVLALKAMPPGLREVYRTDPKLQSTIKIMMDSIGHLHFMCTTAERTYWEKSTRLQRLVESLTTELTKKNYELTQAKETIKEKRRTIFDDIKGFFRTSAGIIVIVIILVCIATVIGLVNKFRHKAL